jgi:putative spermidine/putrescine transport system permease protein
MRGSRTNDIGLLAPVFLLLTVFFAVPTLLMFALSLREYVEGQGIGQALTASSYMNIIQDGYYLAVVGRTLFLGLVVTGVCLILGYPLAIFIVRSSQRIQSIAILLVIFPLLLNIVVRSFGLIMLLAPGGIINELLIQLNIIDRPIRLMYNLAGVVIGLTQIHLPFLVLLIIPALQSIPQDLEAAAATMSAGRIRTFVSITLPLSLPGAIAGSILVFVLSISALVTPRMLGGPTYSVMATQIYDEFMVNLNWPIGAALAFLLTGITLMLVAASNALVSRLTRGYAA